MASTDYAGSAMAEQWSRTDSPRARSVFEQTAAVLEEFTRVHGQSLHAIEQIRSSSSDAQLALLIQIVLDEKSHDQRILQRISITLRDALNWTRSTDALPLPVLAIAPGFPALISAACTALEQERASARSLRRLVRQVRGINAGLMSVLLDAMVVTSENHARLLQFGLARLRSPESMERPWRRRVACLLLGRWIWFVSRLAQRDWSSPVRPIPVADHR